MVRIGSPKEFEAWLEGKPVASAARFGPAHASVAVFTDLTGASHAWSLVVQFLKAHADVWIAYTASVFPKLGIEALIAVIRKMLSD